MSQTSPNPWARTGRSGISGASCRSTCMVSPEWCACATKSVRRVRYPRLRPLFSEQKPPDQVLRTRRCAGYYRNMTQEAPEEQDPKQVKRNLVALLIDVISYWVGAAFTDPMTVLMVLMLNLGAT